MLRGFFSRAEFAGPKPLSLIPKCGACGLFRNCHSPKMEVAGAGQRGVLIAGEAPGCDEDEKGIPFIGKAGQKLRGVLKELGINTTRDCWITNSLICHPWEATSDGKKNRTPTDKEIEHCRPNLTNSIRKLNPKTIILLGGVPMKSLLGTLWKEDIGSVGRWVGWKIPCRNPNSWICPTWHPSFLLRSDEDPVLEKQWRHHLSAAFALKERPWKDGQDHTYAVEKIRDPEKAAIAIRDFFTSANVPPIAFDLETDRIKPDHPDSRIVCCSVSNGDRTIAFPWYGKAVVAMKELLTSSIPKVGWNIKFESRWIKTKLGVWVRNWIWDGMLAAHILDSRPEITGLKFQSFIRLGQPDYDSSMKEFLKAKSKGGNEPNKIKEAGLDALLFYCGMDALLEWKICRDQMAEVEE